MKYLIPVIPLVAAVSMAAAQAPTPASPVPSVLLGPNPLSPSPQVQDEALPAFEVASVKSNSSGVNGPMMSRMLPNRFEATGIPVRLLLLQSYRLPSYQIQGVPSWVDMDATTFVPRRPKVRSRIS